MSLLGDELENNLFKVDISYSELEISKKEVALSLGYINGTPPSYFSDIIDEVLNESERRCEIKAGYKLTDIRYDRNQKKGILIGDTFFNTDKIVTVQLKKSEKAVLFIDTIGPMMEDWSRELIEKGDPVYGFIVDTAASVIVESVTDFLHDYIGREMQKKGWKITNRYSPGYCNWPVAEQQKLFSKFPRNFCGITLTESSMMLPKKSISGIIGTGSKVEMKEYLCDKCGMKDCTYMAKRQKTPETVKVK